MTLRQVYRPGRINWNLLVNPSMQALAIREAGSRDMNRSIMAGLVDVGQGIVRGRQEKESARRFDEQMEISQGHLDIAESRHEFDKRKYEEDLLEKQAFDEALIGALEQTGGQAANELAVHGDLTPQTASSLKQQVQGLGGPPAAVQKYVAAQQQKPMSFEEYARTKCPT